MAVPWRLGLWVGYAVLLVVLAGVYQCRHGDDPRGLGGWYRHRLDLRPAPRRRILCADSGGLGAGSGALLLAAARE
jgi:hypothetical protein